MPPPISQQGSRGGLITAVVIFAILWVTATIFAFYFQVNMRAMEGKLAEQDKKYKNVIADKDLSSESDFAQVATALKADQALSDPSLKWVDLLLERGNRLAKVIEGNPAPALQAETDATTRLAADKELLRKAKLGDSLIGTDNLIGTIDALTKALISKDDELTTAKKNFDISQTANLAMVQSSKEANEAAKKGMEDAEAASTKATTEAAADRDAKQKQIEQITADIKKATDDLNNKIQEKQVQVSGLTGQLAAAQKQIDSQNTKLATYRMNTVETAVRRVAGNISKVTGGNTVYINLGQGDQVVDGMTFEVYDKAEGVPKLGEGMRDEDLPVGKGSIEIINIGATTSECRIVKTTPGQQIAEGDLLVNLVYNPNVKFNFLVYGKFDLAQTGKASDNDTEIVKRLVTQWGGKLTDQVNADTDFVVLGKEPVLPQFSKEELEAPENAKKLADAQAELDAYAKVRADARDMHIPLMNQNRFLYFVGYYDQAKR